MHASLRTASTKPRAIGVSPASRRLTQAIRIAAAVAAELEFGFKS